jgi:DNA polymerase elongation subunit (family B)
MISGYYSGNVVIAEKKRLLFTPYLFVIGSSQPPQLQGVADIKRSDLNPYVYDGTAYSSASGMRAYVVYAESPGVVPKLKEEYWRRGFRTSQSYIKFALRAAVDLYFGCAVGKCAKRRRRFEPIVEPRPVKIMAVDVEVVNGRAIYGYTEDGKKVDYAEDPVEVLSAEDVDYIVTYNGWGFDYKYLNDLCLREKPGCTKYAVETPWGYVPILDLYVMARGGFKSAMGLQEESYTLYDVARQLGAHAERGISERELYRVKRMRSRLTQLTQMELKAYLGLDVLMTYHTAVKMVPIMETIGNMIGGGAGVVNVVAETSSPGLIGEVILQKELEHDGIVVAERDIGALIREKLGISVNNNGEDEEEEDERDETRKVKLYRAGEKVRLRRAGVYRNVAEYDFRAMYPSLMANDGVDPINARECADGFTVETIEGVKRVCFAGGHLSRLADMLLSAREEAKKKSKALDQAVKILANSLYGIFGKRGIGIQNLWVAGYIAQKTETIFGDLWNKYKPIYGDTDSMYIPLESRDPTALMDEINSYLSRIYGPKMQVKLEEVWDYVVYLPDTNKNYVKIKGERTVLKGAALALRRMPLALRVRGTEWVKKIVELHLPSLVYKLLESAPDEELFIETSMTWRDFFYVKRSDKFIDRLDTSRLPIAAYLAYSRGPGEYRPEEFPLDDFVSVLYLPIETTSGNKSFLIYDSRIWRVSFFAVADPKTEKVVVRRATKRQVDRQDALEVSKRVASEYPVVKFLSQSTLL